MVFGKIEYLNLLPFHVFMKRFTSSSQQKMSMQYYRGVPAQVNKKFTSRRVDAAFISSVSAKKYRHVGLGIIAKAEVQSVIVVPSANNEADCESASSNVLANILHIKGKVLIGDKALKYALSSCEYIDLAEEWHRKYNLPFVFALLCFHKDVKLYRSIEKQFLKQKIKIPQYILEKASQRTKIDKKEINNYLNYISYRLDSKAKLGLKKFYSLT
ncbi:MAG: chorismate dehydratase [Sulfurimonas sp.]|jgi:chorismate dehydratase|uniref:MqnA/MqnD/SBP family protein n=1 Tax=Sulfurimonas sp. TaxID=2022749 RepID=UPI0039E3D2F0